MYDRLLSVKTVKKPQCVQRSIVLSARDGSLGDNGEISDTNDKAYREVILMVVEATYGGLGKLDY